MARSLRITIVVAAIAWGVFVGSVLAQDDTVGKKKSSSAAAHHATFAQVVHEHFAQWDQNHDGALDVRELDEAIRRLGVHGEAAAALATIKSRERMAMAAKATEFAETEQELTADVDHLPIHALDAAQGEAKPFRYEAVFNKHLENLTNVNRRLYAGDKPDFALMHQGSIGDCFFFSVVGNLAAHQPDRIRQMIVAEKAGGYLVHFGDGHQVKVARPSDVEIVINNSVHSIEDGIWLTVLEKAVGKRLSERSKSFVKGQEVTDAISHGGSTRAIIGMLTGHQTDVIALRDKKHEVERLAQLRRVVPEALAAHRLVAVSMGKEPPSGNPKVPKLGYGHAYAVFGFKPNTDQIKLWNPWGNDVTPKGPSGPEHGFETKHGIFEVPLKTLYDQFSNVSVETTRKFDPEKSSPQHKPK
ncbi:MAG TPA: C2 family cysteine protease [Pirellulales bacterium]|jgi:hypothetical protein|nr:C2 family cysteine protease [Pirellulales bacterium]